LLICCHGNLFTVSLANNIYSGSTIPSCH
jgi:hypothetical protein